MLLTDAIQELIIATRSAGRSIRTVEVYQRHLKYFCDYLGNPDISEITASDLRRYAVSLQDRTMRYVGHPTSGTRPGGLERDSISSYMRAVKRLFNWLASENMISVNPARGLRLPRSTDRDPKSYDVDDFVRLLIATQGNTPIRLRDRALLLLLADTGCRVGGLTRLRLDDLDINKRMVRLHEKGERFRSIPFSVATLDALMLWLDARPKVSEDWVFINLGPLVREVRLTEDAVGEVFRRLKKRAKVKGRVNPHSFRHGFAREWIRAGGDLATLARMLGHVDPSITLRYYARFQADELHNFHARFSPVVRLYGEDTE
jgi:site-specific recombinase XerD